MAARKAFVLILADMGQVGLVRNLLTGRKGVVDVEVITGPYDIIATLSGSDTNEIADIVVNSVHSVPGIKHTITMIAV